MTTVTFTQNKQLLRTIASTLATEATAAGLTSLSNDLNDFSSEMAQSLTNEEFFGGTTEYGTWDGIGTDGRYRRDEDSVGLVWAQTLIAAAEAIKTKRLNQIKTDITSIEGHHEIIKDKMVIIQDDISRIRDLGDREEDGIGFRTIQPFGEINVAIMWLLYIERGKILDLDLDNDRITELLGTNQEGNPDLRRASLARLDQLLDRIRNANLGGWG